MEISLPILILLLILMVAITIVTLFYKPRKKKLARDRYTLGLDMLVTGKRKEAYQLFKSIIQEDTDNIQAYLKLGQVVREGGNPVHALKIHKSLIIRKNLTDYEKIELQKNLALDQYSLKNLSEAIAEIKKILAIEKKNEWALVQLVKFSREMDDWNNAGEYLKQLLKSTGQTDNHKLGLYKLQQGRMALKRNEYKQALTQFDEALKLDKVLWEAHFFKGNVHAAESDNAFEQALAFEEKTPQSSKDRKLHQQAVDEAKDKLSKAISEWSIFAEKDPEHAWLVLSRLSDGLFALERFDEISKILQKVLKKDSGNIDALTELANYYVQKGDAANALDLTDQVLEKDDNSLQTRLIRLKISIQKKDYRNLIQDVDKLIELVSKNEYGLKHRSERNTDMKWLFSSSGDLENFKE